MSKSNRSAPNFNGNKEEPSAKATVIGTKPARVTREHVFAAAWELTKNGNRPTIDRIRMLLGNGTPRGSPNTVNAHLTEWWRHLAIRLQDSPGAAIPVLPARISAALESLWAEALASAQDTCRDQWLAREQLVKDREVELDKSSRQLEEKSQALAEVMALSKKITRDHEREIRRLRADLRIVKAERGRMSKSLVKLKTDQLSSTARKKRTAKSKRTP